MKNKSFTITSFYKFVYWSIESKHRYQPNPTSFNAAMLKYIKSFNKKEIKDLESYKWKSINEFAKNVFIINASIDYNFNMWTLHFQNSWERLKLTNTIKAIVAWHIDDVYEPPEFGILYRYRDIYIKLPYYFNEDILFLTSRVFEPENKVKICN